MREKRTTVIDMFLKRLARNFLTCSLSNESRTREPPRRSSYIDLINERFIQRDIDSYGSPGIGEQWNRKQDRPSFDGCIYISVTQDIVCVACRWQSPARAFKRLCMLPQCSSRVRNSLFQRFAGRETSLHIRKPDAEGAVSLFFHNRYITHRHCFEIPSRPPTSQFVNAAHQPGRQIPPRMCHCDDHVPARVLIRMMITINSIKNPPIPLQHSNQLAAVSFHNPASEADREISSVVQLSSRTGSKPASTAGSIPHRTRVYKSR